MLILDEVRCPDCGRKLMELCGQASIKCPKCKAMVFVDTNKRKNAVGSSTTFALNRPMEEVVYEGGVEDV